MIGIIDYGMGNILSVKNVVEFLGAKVKICNKPEDMDKAEKIILPGVGSFGNCVKNLHKRGFWKVLHNDIMIKRKPILGVCLGMQVMAKKSFENGEFMGLGWFDAEVVRIKPNNASFRVPHVGWNNVHYSKKSFIFRGLPESFDAYFVHSFSMNCRNQTDIIATFEYGGNFVAAVQKKNIVATQFHPEKSQDYGLTILENFLRWDTLN